MLREREGKDTGDIEHFRNMVWESWGKWTYAGLARWVEVRNKGHICRELALVLVVTLQLVSIMHVGCNRTVLLV